MPLLAAFLGSAFTAFATFIGGWLTKRVALTIAGVAALGVVFMSFYVALRSLAVGLITAFPVVSGLFNCFLPSNLTACLSVIFSAMIIKWVYHWQTKIIQLKLGI